MTEDETVQKGLYSLFGAGGFAPGNLGHSFADMPGADAFEAIERRFRR